MLARLLAALGLASAASAAWSTADGSYSWELVPEPVMFSKPFNLTRGGTNLTLSPASTALTLSKAAASSGILKRAAGRYFGSSGGGSGHGLIHGARDSRLALRSPLKPSHTVLRNLYGLCSP